MRYSIFFQFLGTPRILFRKNIYDQFKIGGNLNPSNWQIGKHMFIDSSSRPISGNSQATTLMEKQKGGQV